MAKDKTPVFKSKSKEGRYTVLAISKGAGDEHNMRGHSFVTYQCNKTGDTFVREYNGFKGRMEQIEI
jgi:hypothetical protein